MLSIDYVTGAFNQNSSIPALSPFTSEMLAFLGTHSQHRSILLPDYGHSWNGLETPQQPPSDHSTYNPPQQLPAPETGDIASRPEVPVNPRRRRQDPERSSVGQNPYGRNGTLRCELCRRWR